ncbi:MAG TPA: hypothetical protein VNC42_11235 [Bradyrhizobium sp.]|nr:hypothetical protein [Bradyrhizobium sp.]
MAKITDQLARSFETENTGGLLTGFLAEEDELDRNALWRLGSWGAASVGAVIVALLASQSSIGLRRDQVAAADLVRQSQQIQAVARESQSETRRLAAAIDTLNSDRDRLYSRVTVLEQGLDSVTGAIARQNSTAASAQAAATFPTAETQAAQGPAAAPVATTVAAMAEKPRAALPEQAPAPPSSAAQETSNAPAATPLMASKSIMAPPDSAAGKLIEPDPVTPPKPEVVAYAPPVDNPGADASQAAAPPQAVQRTEFGVDVGGANSLNGLRALWRGLLKSKPTASLTTLRPIIVVKESNTGLGMQLRLVAGPLNDAAAAAKICAALIESQRTCETAVFDGQRLAMKADEPAASTKPAAAKPAARRRRVTANEDPPKGSTPSMLSSVFGRR